MPHKERRYAKEDRSRQSDCHQGEPRLQIEQHLAILLGIGPTITMDGCKIGSVHVQVKSAGTRFSDEAAN